MNSKPRPFVESLAYVGAITGVYIGAGVGLGVILDKVFSDEIEIPYRIEGAGIIDEASFNDYVNDTHQLELTTKDLEGRDQTLVVRFGEACVKAVLPYTGGGLANTEEDSAVTDLLTSPKMPCGEEPTEVRQAVHEVRTVKQGLEDAEAANYNQRLANITKTEHRLADGQSDDSIVLGILVGGVLLGGLAMLSTTASELDYRRQRKEWADSEYTEDYSSRKNGLGLVQKKIFKK